MLEPLWWKNPFLWLTLGMGIPSTIMPVAMGDGVDSLALTLGAATFVGTVIAHLSLRARLEIRPDGFREDLAFWRTIEHRWGMWTGSPCSGKTKGRRPSPSGS